MTGAARLGLVAVLATGCTVTVERAGPRAWVEEEGPRSGVRAEAVVAALGMPDEIDATEQGFAFVYHFVRRTERRFQVGSYGFKLATDERVEQREGSFELLFDGRGRLLGSTVHDLPPPESERAD